MKKKFLRKLNRFQIIHKIYVPCKEKYDIKEGKYFLVLQMF